MHDGVLFLIRVICLPSQDWVSLGQSQPPALLNGLGVPGGGKANMVPWLGFAQLSVLDSFFSCQADPTSSFFFF